MKILFVILAVSMLAGCSSTPTKYLMKNCEAVGDNLYECEEIPQKDFQPHGRGI